MNDFLEIVTSSNLLLRHPNTTVDVVEGLKEATGDETRNKSLLGRPGNLGFWLRMAQNRMFWHVSGRKSLSRDT